MISDSERREVAERMRKRANEGVAFVGTHIANAIMVDFFNDRECWNRLADLIEQDRIPDNLDKTGRDLSEGARDALLALADDVKKIRLDNRNPGMEACAYFGCEYVGCDMCRAFDNDGPCLECAVDDVSQRIREALDACETRPDAPAAGDEGQTATDARMDDSEAAEGYHRVDVSDKFNENIAAIDFVRENGGLEAVKARLMPEGMEWPRFEDDAPVRMCEEAAKNSESFNISTVTLCNGGDFLLNFRAYPKGKRVKRPAPKVYDADGVEIKRGDTVWPTENPKDGYVLGGEVLTMARADGGRIRVDFLDESGNISTYYASELTHRKPIIAADGRPMHEGEHVWHVETGIELVVKELPKPGEYQAVVVFAPPASHLTSFDPDQLTHERPDSWELLEADCSMNTGVYTRERMGIDVGKVPAKESRRIDMMRDLVRRAKALAERGER